MTGRRQAVGLEPALLWSLIVDTYYGLLANAISPRYLLKSRTRPKHVDEGQKLNL